MISGCTTTRRCTRRAPGPGRWCRCSCSTRPSPRPRNRARFLAESLADLRASLRERGADLVLRRGDPAAEVIRLAAEVRATAVYLADDVSHYAAARRRGLERECGRHRIELTLTPGLTVVPPGRPEAGRRRALPGLHPVLAGLARGHLARALPGPAVHRDASGREDRPPPREPNPPRRAWPGAARRPAASGSPAGGSACWPATPENHDDLAGDATSRLGAYLRFGCVSPLEVAIGALDRPAAGEEFCRQLAWRDFFYQVTAAFPDIARKNYRPGAAWHEDAARAGRLARGPDRDPDRGRRDAPAGRRGLHAQPGPDGHRLVPHPQPRHRLAARLRALRLPARRRRRGEQRGQLAVGGRDRQQHPAQPGDEPAAPGPAVRQVRPVRPPLRAGAGRPRPRRGSRRRGSCQPAQRVRMGYPGPLVELA